MRTDWQLGEMATKNDNITIQQYLRRKSILFTSIIQTQLGHRFAHNIFSIYIVLCSELKVHLTDIINKSLNLLNLLNTR